MRTERSRKCDSPPGIDGDEDGVPLDGAEDSEDVGVVEAWQERMQEVLDPGAHEFNLGS